VVDSQILYKSSDVAQSLFGYESVVEGDSENVQFILVLQYNAGIGTVFASAIGHQDIIIAIAFAGINQFQKFAFVFSHLVFEVIKAPELKTEIADTLLVESYSRKSLGQYAFLTSVHPYTFRFQGD
jgi:hypothetical protein